MCYSTSKSCKLEHSFHYRTSPFFFFQIIFLSYYLDKTFNTRSKFLCFPSKRHGSVLTVSGPWSFGNFCTQFCAVPVGGVGEGNGGSFSRQNLGLRERSGLLPIFLRCPMDFRFLWYLHNTICYCGASDTSFKAFDRMLIRVCKKVFKVTRQNWPPCFLSFMLLWTFYRNKTHPRLCIASFYF